MSGFADRYVASDCWPTLAVLSCPNELARIVSRKWVILCDPMGYEQTRRSREPRTVQHALLERMA